MSEVLASYGRIQLTSEVDSNIPYYNVSEINWTQQEKEILDDLKSFITEYKLIQKQVDAIRNIQEKEEFLKGIIEDRIKQKKIVTENTNELVIRH